jgi:hypothetical protein
MLKSTSALVGALIAVLSESTRLERLIASGNLSETEEERLIDRTEQMHAAYGDLAEKYERRLVDQPGLLTLDALKARVEAERADGHA